MPSRLLIAIIFAVVGLAAPMGCGGDKRFPARRLTIATGSAGGVYSEYGAAVVDAVNRYLPRLHARVLATEGSVESLRRLEVGQADVAFTRADSVEHELQTHRVGAGVRRVVALARLYDSYVQVVVRASSRIRVVADLARCGVRRCRVAVGPAGSGTRLLAERVLSAAGLATGGVVLDESDIQRAVDRLAEGRVDAVVWAGGLPTPAIAKVARRVPLRVADLGLVAGKLLKDHPNVYTRTRLPRGAYGTNASVGTVSVANYLVVRGDLSEPVAYAITAMLFAHRDELVRAHVVEAGYLDVNAAIDTFPLALHPGAERYYRRAAG